MAPTTTTTTINTAVVPKHITVAYVNAVLAKLNHLYGDAGRSMVANHRITDQVFRDLGAIYTPSLEMSTVDDFSQTLAGGLKNIRRHPGDEVTRVAKLIYTSPTCIFASVHTTAAKVDVHPIHYPAQEYAGLIPNPYQHKPWELNKTAWIFFYDVVNPTPTYTPDECPYPRSSR